MGGGSGDSEKGDKNVQHLIDNKIMKEWMQDGVRTASYRNIKVGIEQGVTAENKIDKVCAFLIGFSVLVCATSFGRNVF
jgi:hypothetical protein